MITYDIEKSLSSSVAPTHSGWIVFLYLFKTKNKPKLFHVSPFEEPKDLIGEHVKCRPYGLYWSKNKLIISADVGTLYVSSDGKISSSEPLNPLIKCKGDFSAELIKDLRVPDKVGKQWMAGDSTRVMIRRNKDTLTLNVPGIGLAADVSSDGTSLIVVTIKKIHILDNPFFT